MRSHYQIGYRGGIIKRFATRFINLTTATLFFATTFAGAAPLLLTTTAHADAPVDGVVINEFSSYSSVDWVELYNTTSSAVSLNGWKLENSSNTNSKIADLSGSLGPNAYLKVGVGDRLNQDGDIITLVHDTNHQTSVAYGNKSGAVIGAPGDGQSAGQLPDGMGNWQIFDTPTPGQPNKDTPACSYDFQSQKMWEVTWGYDFAHRNGGAPIFNTASDGGLISVNGSSVPSYITSYDAAHGTGSYHWLYITDHGASNNQSLHYDYGFADGVVRTADVIWNDVNNCQTPEISWGYNTSSTNFVDSPKYVRINNAGDLAAQLVTPDSTTAVNFYIDGDTSNPIAGSDVGGAGATTSWWRLYAPLSAGKHTISAAININGSWQTVSGTGVVYALGNPAGDFVSPSSDGQYFRPSDNPLRITADDTNDSFADVVFHVDGKDYLVTRSQCDLREAGNRVLCDVNKAVANASRHTDTWNNLAEGHYTATATIYNQARNHIDATSFGFNVDGTPPVVLNAAIVSPNQSVYKDSVVVAQYVQESNQLNGVSLYITQPRSDGQCDPNEAKVLDPISAHFVNRNGDKWYYRTTVNTSSLNGKYCIFSTAEDAAMNHSNPQQAKFSATFDNTAPTGTATYAGGTVVGGTQYLKSIDDLSFTATINDNNSVVRATYLVQKLNTNNNKYEGFCGNWNANSTGSHTLGGSTHEVYTESNIKSCAANPASWTDGTYKIFHAAYDAAGNEGKFNTTRHIFVIDSVRPTVTFINPSDFNNATYDQYLKVGPNFQIKATDQNGITGTVAHIYNANGTHSTAWCGAATPGDSTSCDASGLADGNYYIKAGATDPAGNNQTVTKYFTVDNTAPKITRWIVNGTDYANPYSLTDGQIFNSKNINVQFKDNVKLSKVVINGQDIVGKWGDPKSFDASWYIKQYMVEGTNTVVLHDAAGNTTNYSFIYDGTTPAVGDVIVQDGNRNTMTGTIYNPSFIVTTGNTDGSGTGIATVHAWVYDATTNQKVLGLFTQGSTNLDYWLSKNLALLRDSGSYYLDVWTIDKAGNESVHKHSATFTLDHKAPAVPTFTMFDANGKPVTNGYITTKDFTFNLSSPSSDVTRYQLKYTNDITGATVPSWSPTDLSITGHMNALGVYTDNFTMGQGVHHFEFSACDAAGNCSVFSSPFTVTYDNTAPDAPTIGFAENTTNGTQNVTLADADTSAAIYYTLDGTDPTNSSTLYTDTFQLDPRTNPGATIKAIAYDPAGNNSTVTTEAAPTITNEASLTPTTSSIILQWTTDEPATSRVIYDTVSHAALGTGNNYGYTFSTTEDSTLTTDHSVLVSGLTPSTTYYFRFVSHGSPITVSDELSSVTLDKKATQQNGGTPTFRVTSSSTTPTGNQSVLGAQTTTTPSHNSNNNANDNNRQVKGDSTTKPNDKVNNSGAFLGLGWWWLLIVAVVLGLWWLLAARRRADDDK